MNEIRPGQSIELLKELHILTRDGQSGLAPKAQASLSFMPIY
jgi:hypothetical protein